jgi:hypothetical protein
MAWNVCKIDLRIKLPCRGLNVYAEPVLRVYRDPTNNYRDIT